MCLLVFAVNAHPRYRLILAGNRDEFHKRATAPAQWWNGQPAMLAGRDIEAGGTWLGIDGYGRFGAVTNIRDMKPAPAGAPSRGGLVTEFVRGDLNAEHFLAKLRARSQQFAGFNLVLGDQKGVHFFNNRSGYETKLTDGVYGLSNDRLDTPWPKVVKATARVRALLKEDAHDEAAQLDVFADRGIAPDASLPDTGVGLEFERMLSACFIVSPLYGTRSTTVIRVDYEGQARFCERQFDVDGEMSGQRDFDFMTISGDREQPV